MTATGGQIRGMLLEEAILHLLKATGYRTVERAGNDPTLRHSSAGLNVRGRGADHQIDAIADFLVQQPFSNPQRLLIEAKCLDEGKRARLSIIRNALGTLTDVSEYWVREAARPSRSDYIPKPRYHYQYAVFSATGFTRPAQDYAFAQDIYLFPLANSAFFRPVIDEIRRAAEAMTVDGSRSSLGLAHLRTYVRDTLRHDYPPDEQLPGNGQDLQAFLQTCREVNEAMLATLGGQFPVFLVPARGVRIDELPDRLTVRITWDDEGWYISSPELNSRGERLFTFDLPEELFRRYDEGGRLSPLNALDLKEDVMSNFQAVHARDDHLEIIQFRLESGWLDSLREKLKTHPRKRKG